MTGSTGSHAPSSRSHCSPSPVDSRTQYTLVMSNTTCTNVCHISTEASLHHPENTLTGSSATPHYFYYVHFVGDLV
ncbi:hypothetical protein E2C01_030473 [Portunus trituberculatus]|uniref:Uncharacterized protein n=1 Tax=Portunus trituberculatus TaxID=210409 RepID=A0A5B7EQX8_PORTR|nr:hypothetical protein [Portunus trituberculatus]